MRLCPNSNIILFGIERNAVADKLFAVMMMVCLPMACNFVKMQRSYGHPVVEPNLQGLQPCIFCHVGRYYSYQKASAKLDKGAELSFYFFTCSNQSIALRFNF
ncbi:hypothetical protein L6452_03918 [Arctium lappa]|uniref:Uncharacterized protein n=1 Tax=Arctium lappa TaxID=4217 RepID=A0ACB9FNK4_ARCLA|nr:hypothetical protein L6452_03918 [Arctium lappa]